MEKCMDMDMDNHMCMCAGKNMDRYCFSFYT